MEAVARALIEADAVMIRPETPFRLASGRLSPVYVDCRRLLSFPVPRRRVIGALADVAREEIGLDAFEVIAGGETAGIPFAAILSHELDKPMIYVRKIPKGHGGERRIEGVLQAGARVLLVEDLVTDGGSKLVFQEGIEAAGGRVEHCLCVFEYYSHRAGLQEARARLKEHGMALHSLAQWDELFDLLISRGALTLDRLGEVLAFLRNTGDDYNAVEPE